MGILTYRGTGYGSGTFRDLYIDGQYAGTEQVPSGYEGRDEEWFRARGYTTASMVSEETARAAAKEAQRIIDEKHARIVAHEEEQKQLMRDFSGREAQERYAKEDQAKVATIQSPFSIETQKNAEVLLKSETTQFSDDTARQKLYDLVTIRNPDVVPAKVYYPDPIQEQNKLMIMENRQAFGTYIREKGGITPFSPFKTANASSANTSFETQINPETQQNINAFAARQADIDKKYEGANRVVDSWAGTDPYKKFAGEGLQNFMGWGKIGETAVNVGAFGLKEPRELKRSLPSFEQTAKGTGEMLEAGFVTPIREKGWLVGGGGIVRDFALLWGVGKGLGGLGKAGSAFKSNPEIPLRNKMFGGEYTPKASVTVDNIPTYRKMFGAGKEASMTEPAPFAELKKGWIPTRQELFGSPNGGRGYPVRVGFNPTETVTIQYGDIKITGSPERLMDVKRLSNIGEERNILVGQRGIETATIQYGDFEITGHKSNLIDLNKFDIKSPVRVDMERIALNEKGTGYIGGKQTDTLTQQYGAFTVKVPRNRIVSVSEFEMKAPKPAKNMMSSASSKGIFSKEGLKTFLADESGKMYPKKQKANLGESAFQILKSRRRVYYDEPEYIRAPKKGMPVRVVPVVTDMNFERTREIQSERITNDFRNELRTHAGIIQRENLRTPERTFMGIGQGIKNDLGILTLTETSLKQEQATIQKQEQAQKQKQEQIQKQIQKQIQRNPFRELQQPRRKPPREPPKLRSPFSKPKSGKKGKKETIFGFREYTNPIHSLEGFEKPVKQKKSKGITIHVNR